MARAWDAAKRQAWRKRFQRFLRSGLSVAAFCETEGVSVPSFYQWRRKLAADGAEAVPASPGRSSPAFVPVRMVNTASASLAPAAATVEIRLPNGAWVRMPVADRQALEAAIAAAGRAAAAAGEEGAPC